MAHIDVYPLIIVVRSIHNGQILLVPWNMQDAGIRNIIIASFYLRVESFGSVIAIEDRTSR